MYLRNAIMGQPNLILTETVMNSVQTLLRLLLYHIKSLLCFAVHSLWRLQ